MPANVFNKIGQFFSDTWPPRAQYNISGRTLTRMNKNTVNKGLTYVDLLNSACQHEGNGGAFRSKKAKTERDYQYIQQLNQCAADVVKAITHSHTNNTQSHTNKTGVFPITIQLNDNLQLKIEIPYTGLGDEKIFIKVREIGLFGDTETILETLKYDPYCEVTVGTLHMRATKDPLTVQQDCLQTIIQQSIFYKNMLMWHKNNTSDSSTESTDSGSGSGSIKFFPSVPDKARIPVQKQPNSTPPPPHTPPAETQYTQDVKKTAYTKIHNLNSNHSINNFTHPEIMYLLNLLKDNEYISAQSLQQVTEKQVYKISVSANIISIVLINTGNRTTNNKQQKNQHHNQQQIFFKKNITLAALKELLYPNENNNVISVKTRAVPTQRSLQSSSNTQNNTPHTQESNKESPYQTIKLLSSDSSSYVYDLQKDKVTPPFIKILIIYLQQIALIENDKNVTHLTFIKKSENDIEICATYIDNTTVSLTSVPLKWLCYFDNFENKMNALIKDLEQNKIVYFEPEKDEAGYYICDIMLHLLAHFDPETYNDMDILDEDTQKIQYKYDSKTTTIELTIDDTVMKMIPVKALSQILVTMYPVCSNKNEIQTYNTDTPTHTINLNTTTNIKTDHVGKTVKSPWLNKQLQQFQHREKQFYIMRMSQNNDECLFFKNLSNTLTHQPTNNHQDNKNYIITIYYDTEKNITILIDSEKYIISSIEDLYALFAKCDPKNNPGRTVYSRLVDLNAVNDHKQPHKTTTNNAIIKNPGILFNALVDYLRHTSSTTYSTSRVPQLTFTKIINDNTTQFQVKDNNNITLGTIPESWLISMFNFDGAVCELLTQLNYEKYDSSPKKSDSSSSHPPETVRTAKILYSLLQYNDKINNKRHLQDTDKITIEYAEHGRVIIMVNNEIMCNIHRAELYETLNKYGVTKEYERLFYKRTTTKNASTPKKQPESGYIIYSQYR